MRENVCWYYEQGWPFLLVETSTENGAARVDRVRVATQATLGRERALRGHRAAPSSYPFSTIWRNRGLIRAMVRRDILGRYRGCFGGAFWTIINPLLLMLTYFFVFGVVLRDRYDPNATWWSFALYFLAGMLPWLAFSEAAGRAPGRHAGAPQFRQEAGLRGGDAAGQSGGRGAGHGAVRDPALLRVPARDQSRSCRGALIWLPVLLIPQILFTAGVSWFLAALGVFVRDLGQIMGFLLTLWFFLTPICYPENKLPHAAAGVLTKNPIYVLVHGYRSILPAESGARIQRRVEAVAAVGGGIPAGPRVVLQIAQVVPGFALKCRGRPPVGRLGQDHVAGTGSGDIGADKCRGHQVAAGLANHHLHVMDEGPIGPARLRLRGSVPGRSQADESNQPFGARKHDPHHPFGGAFVHIHENAAAQDEIIAVTAHDALRGVHIRGKQFHSGAQAGEVLHSRFHRVPVDIETMQNCGRGKNCFLQMTQQVTCRATDLKNRANVLSRVQPARAQMRRNLTKKDVPGWIDGSGAEPSVNLVALGVSQMIRPKVTVEADRVAAAHVVQHPHGELESTGQLAPSNEGDKVLTGSQREHLAHKSDGSPDHPTNGGFGLTPHTAHMHGDARDRTAAY